MSKNPFYSSNPFYANEQETNNIRNFHYGGADVANKAYDYDEEEDYDDDYDDDDDDDDYDEEEEEEGALPSSNMSLSLMKALGMDTAGVDEVATDWRPPSQCGLQHSARKFDNYHEMLLIVFAETYCMYIDFHRFIAIVRPGSRSNNHMDIVPTNERISNRATTFILPSSKPMSVSLMKALGIDTNNVVQEAKA